ncbi:MAG: sulfotransferase family protein [Gammaproteobacteria bacterium]
MKIGGSISATARDRGAQFGLLAFIKPMTLLRLAMRIATVSPKKIPRLLGILGASVGGLPLSTWQTVTHASRIRNQRVHDAPVFIIGHWRSGTTLLHNLMSQDPQFGCLRMFTAIAPGCSLATSRWLPSSLSRVIPRKRPMDNMEWPMDAPQEEEIPLAKITPYSGYQQFLFPGQSFSTFERFVLLNNSPSGARNEVSRCLYRLMQIASAHEGGKRLLMKNPVNTARVPLLLELFPNARFIFLHRSPYDVFRSTKNLNRKILELTALQPFTEDTIEANVLAIFPLLLEQYLRDRDRLAPNRLIEVGFAELEAAPNETIEKIYSQLELPDYATARKPIEDYVRTLSRYQKNSYPALTEREKALVDRYWHVAFSEWGYEPDGDGPLPTDCSSSASCPARSAPRTSIRPGRMPAASA